MKSRIKQILGKVILSWHCKFCVLIFYRHIDAILMENTQNTIIVQTSTRLSQSQRVFWENTRCDSHSPVDQLTQKMTGNCITKTCVYNFDPLKPHFYIVKLGFTGVNISFLISAQNHRLWVLVRTVMSRNMKKYQNFLSENFHFLVVKFSVY